MKLPRDRRLKRALREKTRIVQGPEPFTVRRDTINGEMYDKKPSVNSLITAVTNRGKQGKVVTAAEEATRQNTPAFAPARCQSPSSKQALNSIG